jgi:hypothetical protein
MKAVVVAAVAALLAGCAHRPDVAGDPVARAAGWLQGAFDNRAQVRADPRFHAVAVRWIPLWPERDDGRWFVVEQSPAAAPGRPYLRRVHRLRADGTGGVVSEVYLLPGDDPAPLPAVFTPDDLVPQPGCNVVLRPAGSTLRGATRGRGCPSRRDGAAYATAEVVLTASGFVAWDRGFSEDGRQVWGATTGPYDFRRSSEY